MSEYHKHIEHMESLYALLEIELGDLVELAGRKRNIGALQELIPMLNSVKIGKGAYTRDLKTAIAEAELEEAQKEVVPYEPPPFS